MRNAGRAFEGFRLVAAAFLVTAAIDDTHLGSHPLVVATTLVGYFVLICCLWWPRLAAIFFVATCALAVASDHYAPYALSVLFVPFSVGVARRPRWLGVVLAAGLTVAVVLRLGPDESGFHLWILTPGSILSGGLGLALGHVLSKQMQASAAAAAAIRMHELVAIMRHEELATRLHDDIGHALAVISLTAANGHGGTGAQASEALEQIRATCADAAHSLSLAVGTLRREEAARPQLPSEPSLLASDLADTLRQCGWKVDLDWDNRIDLLPSSLRGLTTRFLIEVTTNILKHGEPMSTVSITGRLQGDVLGLRADNQASRHARASASGTGLAALKGAAEALDSELDWSEEAGTWMVRMDADLQRVFGPGFVLDVAESYDTTLLRTKSTLAHGIS